MRRRASPTRVFSPSGFNVSNLSLFGLSLAHTSAAQHGIHFQNRLGVKRSSPLAGTPNPFHDHNRLPIHPGIARGHGTQLRRRISSSAFSNIRQFATKEPSIQSAHTQTRRRFKQGKRHFSNVFTYLVIESTAKHEAITNQF